MSTRSHVADRVQAAILARVAGGVVLIGTANSLAGGFGVSAAALLAGLRDLLEDGRIAARMEPRGRVAIRLADRVTARTVRAV